MKVQEDVAAVEKLGLPKEQEDQMKQQIAMEAVQQGAMLAFASFGKPERSPHTSRRESRTAATSRSWSVVGSTRTANRRIRRLPSCESKPRILASPRGGLRTRRAGVERGLGARPSGLPDR